MADNVIVRVPEQQFIRGEDGYSPEVTIENIDHGHSVTITDRDHPDGQSFNVVDGDSAYEQAVAGGYTGTEEQFNAELAAFKDLSDETKEAAPFYAEYGVTTKAEIQAALNGKRQIYLHHGNLGGIVAPYTGTFLYADIWGEGTGYGFALTNGNFQYVYELKSEWTYSIYDLTAPAQRAEEAADQALIRMNSADASAQAAATTATTFTEQTVPAAVNTINEAKADALTAVGNAQTTAVGAVQQESTTQQAAIQQKGEDTIASIPSDYTTLSGDVDNLKSAANNQEKTYSKGWTRGSYLTTTGAVNNTPIAQNNIRYYSYFGIINGVTRLYCDAGYEFCLFAYTKKGNFIGALREDDTFKIGYVAEAGPLKYITDFLTNAYPEYTFRISLRKNPVSTPDLSEGVNFHCDMLDFGNFQWTGKIAYFYGTSLTAREVNYWSAMRIRMGLSAINKGISGQGIGNFGALSTGGVFNAICNTTDGKTNADLIILETGANDVNENVPLGTIFDDTQSTLAGCLNLCLRYLQANTTAQIVVMPSPAYASAPSASDQKWVWKEMIKDICYINCVHFAEPDNNIGYGRLSGPDSSDYIVDSIHQTEKGAYLTGLSMEKHLKNVPLFEFPEN